MKKLLAGLAVAALLPAIPAHANDGPAVRFLRAPRAFLRGNWHVVSEEVPIGPFNNVWHRPEGGWTLYPGEPGSGFASHSEYSHIDWLVTPEDNAALVRARLRALGIPAVRPEPIFLGRNPRAADGVKLPIPRKIEKKEEKREKPPEDLE
ncbi:MAG: hypothetical protein K2W96_24920 [Gemmataceae bacterium]|nr:hypothetical protein [Gemmataceae bacterium]